MVELARMWVLKRLTSYLYGTTDTILKLLGFSKLAFAITAKVTDEDLGKRYELEVMEFGSSSPVFTIKATMAMLNLICLFVGLKRLLLADEVRKDLLAQFVLCGLVVGINVPIYRAMFFRKDKESMHPSTTVISLCLASVASLVPIIRYHVTSFYIEGIKRYLNFLLNE